MRIELMLLIAILALIVFSIIKRLLYLAVIVVIIAFALYTGIAADIFNVLYPYIQPFWEYLINYIPEPAKVAYIFLK